MVPASRVGAAFINSGDSTLKMITITCNIIMAMPCGHIPNHTHINRVGSSCVIEALRHRLSKFVFIFVVKSALILCDLVLQFTPVVHISKQTPKIWFLKQANGGSNRKSTL